MTSMIKFISSRRLVDIMRLEMIYAANICQLFRGEFIFPTEGLDVNLAKTLRGLESDNVIKVTRNADDLDKVEFVELSDAERECGRENFDFYCFLIWPFIEASWLGAMSLLMLTPLVDQTGEIWLDSKKVQDHAQLVCLNIHMLYQRTELLNIS